MKKSSLLSAATLLVLSTAIAQTPPHVGKWSGTMEGDSGRLLPVEVNLTDTAGTWRMSPPAGAGPGARNNPCFGKELPVAVESSAEALVLNVNGSQVIQGCMDAKISLTLIGAEYKGQTTRGRAVSLTRK